MIFVIALTTVFVGIVCAAVGAVKFVRYLLEKWHVAGRERPGRRLAIVAAGVAAFASPYLACKGIELNQVLSCVPEPLHTSWIEYRLENSFGSIGMPGDNETGFIIYRLTPGSTSWARSKGTRLGDFLPGGTIDWQATPIDLKNSYGRWEGSGRRGSPQTRPMFSEYLDRYGFSIAVERTRLEEADTVIQHRGSFYSYGRGGSITVVSPQRGKVYFAYAG